MEHETTQFSFFHRKEDLEKLKTTEFDLLVIGGGATGTGIALDAAARGLKTALVEKGDFASGTSSKSTKLIHGGLRYLKQLDVALVRETGTERAVVHRLAPHLVLPEKMLMPLIEGGTYGKWATSFGLWVYDVLAGVKDDDRRQMLNKEETLSLEPLLDEKGLKGGGFYAEYRTDDARLTIELIKTAASFGALALNYCKAVDFTYEAGKVIAVECKDKLSGESFSVKAKKIVSAGGPWVDLLRKQDGSAKGKRLHLTKGVHLVFPHDKLPLQHTTYFDAPDGRMIFAIPRGRITYVGTTDTNYQANLDRVVVTKADAEYLLSILSHAFPSVQLNIGDIISNWAGLRPLIHEDGKSPSELSRKDEIFVSDTGLISIAGGKLTGYRKMAQRVVDLVIEKLTETEDFSSKVCQTENIPLTKMPFQDFEEVERFITEITPRLEAIGLETYHATYLVTTYGKSTTTILEKLNSFAEEESIIALGRAELWYSVHHEMICRAEDFFVRRTGQLYFDIENVHLIKDAVLKDLSNYLNWTPETFQSEQDRLEELLYDATHYYEEELS
ncbi:MAG: glycerol-3-phosphate dehydrogenase/oxidase [Saprospiraceae bacterium]